MVGKIRLGRGEFKLLGLKGFDVGEQVILCLLAALWLVVKSGLAPVAEENFLRGFSPRLHEEGFLRND